MYRLLCKDGSAKRGEFTTVHGVIQTPVFMNVGTAAAIKGAVSTEDLENLKTQVELSNTYHLHLRPGDEVIKKLGGIHKFMVWDKPVVTDSGGFQVFSLAKLRKIKEEGVKFSSHIDGRKIFMGPEESMQIQSNIASTIAMAFDECPGLPCERKYMLESVARTERWLLRCKNELNRLNSLPDTINKEQLLFGINQGGVYSDIRIENAKRITDMDLAGYAIGGLAVGEPAEKMYEMIEVVNEILPTDRPRYLMGVGTPMNILEGIERGVDMFDCVMPTRNGRNGQIFTWNGIINFRNAKWAKDFSPVDPMGTAHCDHAYTKAYLHHLFKCKELLALQIASIHNLAFYLELVRVAREHILANDFAEWKRNVLPQLAHRL